MSKNNIPQVVRVLTFPWWVIVPLAILGGTLYAAALPPMNWSIAVFFSLLPLILCAIVCNWKMRLLSGWLWGWGWAVFAYSFLREIHPAVPWLLAPVISLWPALYTLLLGYVARALRVQWHFDRRCQLDIPWQRSLLFLGVAAALFTVLEWTRCRLFVWNDLSVTVWRIPELMQIARITGRYGVTLLLTLINAALFALIFLRRRRWLTAGILLIYPMIALIYGLYRMNKVDEVKDIVVWKCALIQGNLPQQRVAGIQETVNSIQLYCGLTLLAKAENPQTVIWPECAIPIPLRSDSSGGRYYRKMVHDLGCQMLIGSLDFADDGNLTNSALLIAPDGKITGKYDKFHRVPYGEYVPFRDYLPESWIKAFSMGRDLAAGKAIEPLVINDDICAGVAVCYEGVFSYLSAGFARRNANVLAAISNDVWYPQSSEPEQHLANVVMRCVETGLPMVRCGNNGGSGVVDDRGVFTQYIGSPSDRPELLREQAFGTVEVAVARHPELTWAVRFENAIVYLLLIALAAAMLYMKKFKKTGPQI